jgi:hypothetical protein
VCRVDAVYHKQKSFPGGLVYCLALFNELREDIYVGQLTTLSLNDLKGCVEVVHSSLIFIPS